MKVSEKSRVQFDSKESNTQTCAQILDTRSQPPSFGRLNTCLKSTRRVCGGPLWIVSTTLNRVGGEFQYVVIRPLMGELRTNCWTYVPDVMQQSTGRVSEFAIVSSELLRRLSRGLRVRPLGGWPNSQPDAGAWPQNDWLKSSPNATSRCEGRLSSAIRERRLIPARRDAFSGQRKYAQARSETSAATGALACYPEWERRLHTNAGRQRQIGKCIPSGRVLLASPVKVGDQAKQINFSL